MVNVLSMTHGQSLHNLLSDSVTPIHELLAPPPVEDEAPLDVDPFEPLKKESASQATIKQAEKDISELWESQEGEPPIQQENAIDSVWLTETLKAIHWTEKTALSWIKGQLKVEATGSLIDVCNEMPAESLKKFTEHIRLMSEAA
jgi:hypothetical protein